MCVRRKWRQWNVHEKKEGGNRMCVRKRRRQLNMHEKKGRQLNVHEKVETTEHV